MKYSFFPIILLIILLGIQIISVVFQKLVIEIISFIIAFFILISYFVLKIVTYYFAKQIRKIKEKYRRIFYKEYLLRERTKIMRWNHIKVKKDVRGFKFELVPFKELDNLSSFPEQSLSKIITQNILMCNLQACREKEFPLKLVVQNSEIVEETFNKDLVVKTLYRMNWNHLVDTAKTMGETSLPQKLEEEMLKNEEFLKKMHNILFQFQVQEGALVCPDCDRHYMIKNGIPNLLLTDEEITKNQLIKLT